MEGVLPALPAEIGGVLGEDLDERVEHGLSFLRFLAITAAC
jgi:hypothetical protein